MTRSRADYDSPWKERLERFFPEFMAFFFPQAYAEIDWSRPHEFLDKELQQVVREAESGRHTVDKLVKVWRKDGIEAWVLIHIEVQSQVDENFDERMYVYNYRLYDRYKRRVVSLAVLGDEDATWRPESYSYALWGCEVHLRFPTVKLLDYAARWPELEQNQNPFAVVVMAHLRAQATRRQSRSRLRWKVELVKGLYKRGYSRSQVLELFRFIDWIMALPEKLELKFEQAVEELEEAQKMRYVTSIERRAMQKGLEQGEVKNAREAVLDILALRFQTIPQPLIDAINRLTNPVLLKLLLKQAVLSPSLAEFQQALTAEAQNGHSANLSDDQAS